jgi:hypothetical protein
LFDESISASGRVDDHEAERPNLRTLEETVEFLIKTWLKYPDTLVSMVVVMTWWSFVAHEKWW